MSKITCVSPPGKSPATWEIRSTGKNKAGGVMDLLDVWNGPPDLAVDPEGRTPVWKDISPILQNHGESLKAAGFAQDGIIYASKINPGEAE